MRASQFQSSRPYPLVTPRFSSTSGQFHHMQPDHMAIAHIQPPTSPFQETIGQFHYTQPDHTAIAHIQHHPIDDPRSRFRNRGSILVPEPARQLYDVLQTVIPVLTEDTPEVEDYQTIEQIMEINFSLERAVLIVEYYFEGKKGPKLYKNPSEGEINPKEDIKDNLYPSYNDPQTQYLIYMLTTNPEELNRCITAINVAVAAADAHTITIDEISHTASDSDQAKFFAETLKKNYKTFEDKNVAMFGKTMFGHYQTAYLIIKYIKEKVKSQYSVAIKDINSLVTTAIRAGAGDYLKLGIQHFTFTSGKSYTMDDLKFDPKRFRTLKGPTITSGGKSRKRKTKKHTKKQSRKRKRRKPIFKSRKRSHCIQNICNKKTFTRLYRKKSQRKY